MYIKKELLDQCENLFKMPKETYENLINNICTDKLDKDDLTVKVALAVIDKDTSQIYTLESGGSTVITFISNLDTKYHTLGYRAFLMQCAKLLPIFSKGLEKDIMQTALLPFGVFVVDNVAYFYFNLFIPTTSQHRFMGEFRHKAEIDFSSLDDISQQIYDILPKLEQTYDSTEE